MCLKQNTYTTRKYTCTHMHIHVLRKRLTYTADSDGASSVLRMRPMSSADTFYKHTRTHARTKKKHIHSRFRWCAKCVSNEVNILHIEQTHFAHTRIHVRTHTHTHSTKEKAHTQQIPMVRQVYFEWGQCPPHRADSFCTQAHERNVDLSEILNIHSGFRWCAKCASNEVNILHIEQTVIGLFHSQQHRVRHRKQEALKTAEIIISTIIISGNSIRIIIIGRNHHSTKNNKHKQPSLFFTHC